MDADLRIRGQPEAPMKISIGRWALACLLGCALIAVTLLPAPTRGDYETEYWWRPPTRLHEDAIERRLRNVYAHGWRLSMDFKAASDVEAANRLFSVRRDSSADPIVWIAPDVPEFLRRNVGALITSERAERGEWRGHGAVGVMVVTDTATKIGGVELIRSYYGDNQLRTVVLPATPANGNHCVTIVRLRHRALAGNISLSPDRLPLDGCAFTDAFGAPGPKIAEWLRAERYSYARRLSLAQPEIPSKRVRWAGDQGSIQSMQCRGGDDVACIDAAQQVQTWNRIYGYVPPWAMPTAVESSELYREFGDFDEIFLESMVRDLGPARFQRMWRSQKTLPEAYFDETGETFAGWVRGRLVQFYGPYHTGPLPTPNSALLTIVTILAMAALSIRWAPRPYAT
jgi:hypothetical protein